MPMRLQVFKRSTCLRTKPTTIKVNVSCIRVKMAMHIVRGICRGCVKTAPGQELHQF